MTDRVPAPFANIIVLDRKLAEPVVQITDIKARRQARRACQVFLSAPAMGGKGAA